MLLCAFIVIQKLTFRSVLPKYSNGKMTLPNKNDQTWFLIHQHLLDPWGRKKTLAFQALVQLHNPGPADVNA